MLNWIGRFLVMLGVVGVDRVVEPPVKIIILPYNNEGAN